MTIMSSILQNPQASIMSSLLSSTASAAVAIPDSLIRLQETYVGRDGSGGPSNTGDLVGFMADISQMGDVSIPAQPELVTNGGFDADSDWTLNDDMAIQNGGLVQVSGTTGIATQYNIGLLANTTYKFTFDISGRTAGNIYPRLGSYSNIATINDSANQTHTYFVTTGASPNDLIQFVTNVGFDGSIDNISVKKHVDTVDQFLAGQPELVTNGGFDTDSDWDDDGLVSIANGKATWSGFGVLSQTVSENFISGQYYKVTFDFTQLTGGASILIRCGQSSTNDTSVSAGTGFKSVFVKAGGSGSGIYFRYNGSGTFEVDNISVKELPGNHAIAPSDAARPTKTAGGFSLDGVNDILEMPKPSGDLTNCTVLMRWKRKGNDPQGVILTDGISAFLPIYDGGSSTSITNNSGSPIVKIDGVIQSTRGDIRTASASSCDMVITGADLSSWANIKIAGYNSAQSDWMPNIEIADRGFMIFDHTPTDAEIEAAFASMGTLS